MVARLGAAREGRDTDGDGVLRSALVLRGLTDPLTGAIAAAATTSLPESGDGRTWDYRYSGYATPYFSVRSLAALGFEDAADAFRRFIQRSSAGHADELRSPTALAASAGCLSSSSTPCAAGAASGRSGSATAPGPRRQHDVLGQLLDLAWHWHRRGNPPDDDLWRVRLGAGGARGERVAACPTAGCGSGGGSRAISPTRRSCAGWRSTAGSVCRGHRPRRPARALAHG